MPAIGVAALADAPWLLTLNVEKNSPIKSVADLKGKTVSVSTVGSLTEWLVHELSRQQGWGPNGIKTLPIGTDVVADFGVEDSSGGRASSSILRPPTGSRKRGATRILFRFGDMVKDFHIHVIYANRAFLIRIQMPCELFLPVGSKRSHS